MLGQQVSEKEKLNWLRLLRSSNIGPKTFMELMRFFGSAENAITHLPEIAKKLSKGKNQFSLASLQDVEKEVKQAQKLGGKLIFACDPEYPALLKQIPDYPPVITIRGNAELLNKPQLAIVGARNASINACKFAKDIAYTLGQEGWVITSGLARGIDAAAHMGSLGSGTIGVIASGIDHIYPKENKDLYNELYKEGVVVTEYPIKTSPIAQYFPQRNRIISGLSYGVIIVEAAQKSGTLITAKFALEQGREVLAVPGSPLDPRCQGTNSLIKQGATLVETAEDVLNVMAHRLRQTTISDNDSSFVSASTTQIPKEEELAQYRSKLLSSLSYEPVLVDDILEYHNLPTNVVSWLLIELEISGQIRRDPGNYVSLVYDK